MLFFFFHKYISSFANFKIVNLKEPEVQRGGFSPIVQNKWTQKAADREVLFILQIQYLYEMVYLVQVWLNISI